MPEKKNKNHVCVKISSEKREILDYFNIHIEGILRLVINELTVPLARLMSTPEGVEAGKKLATEFMHDLDSCEAYRIGMKIVLDQNKRKREEKIQNEQENFLKNPKKRRRPRKITKEEAVLYGQ